MTLENGDYCLWCEQPGIPGWLYIVSPIWGQLKLSGKSSDCAWFQTITIIACHTSHSLMQYNEATASSKSSWHASLDWVSDGGLCLVSTGALSCVTVSCYLRHGAAQEIETISAGSWNTSKAGFMFKDFYDWILMLWWVDKFPSFTWCWELGTNWFK